jgi:methionyl-tRNA formyltransferase
MRIAFMGTPDFAVPALAELLAGGFDIAAVYTRAPQPSGRGQKPRPSPVEAFARAHGLEARTPANFRGEAEREAFRALDLDAAVVVAYGLILPKAILEAPRLGAFNLHASLLPRWRGAAPIQRAIMAGDEFTGVEVMRMAPALDAGPVLLSQSLRIGPDDTAGVLAGKLARIGAELLPRALAAVARGGAVETPQSEAGATYAEKIAAQEARIDWGKSAVLVDRQVRGLSPFPGAWFAARTARGAERVKALMSRLADGAGRRGEILQSGPRFVVACGEGAVELTSLQRAGKKAQDATEFLRGFPLATGDVL